MWSRKIFLPIVLLTGIGVAKQAEDEIKPTHGCVTELNWSLGGSVDWWIKSTIPGIDALPDEFFAASAMEIQGTLLQ